LWLYAGAGLMLAEIMTPGFVMFFFGMSAATVGILVLAAPDSMTPSFMWQLALFSALSLVYLLTLRRMVKAIFTGDNGQSGKLEDDFAGRLGEAAAAISPGVPGRVVVGDAEWDAVSESHIPAGSKVRVVSRKNLTLKVEPV